MEYSTNTIAAMAVAKAEGFPSSPPPPAPPPVILSPCGACKFLRRRCVEKCILAPYFPPTEPLMFSIVHRVFGASNVFKLLKEIPEDQRADAVNSMVYEANARLRDPIYGCVGTISLLHQQISELQAELARAQAEILNIKCQNANLLEQIHKQMATQNVQENLQTSMAYYDEMNSANFSCDGENLGVSWETLWST